MKYYLRHFDEGWIIEFDDETKQFSAFIKGELDSFEMDTVQVENGKAILEKTEGIITKKAGEKIFTKAQST